MSLKMMCKVFCTFIFIIMIFNISSFGYTLGDMDNDGIINSADAGEALRLSTKKGVYSARADLNFDNKITADEARKIMRVGVGLDQFEIQGFKVYYRTYAKDSTPNIFFTGFYTILNTVRSKNNLAPKGSSSKDGTAAELGLNNCSKMKSELSNAKAKNIKVTTFKVKPSSLAKIDKTAYINDIKKSLKQGKVVIMQNCSERLVECQGPLKDEFSNFNPEFLMLLPDVNQDYPIIIDSVGRVHRFEYSVTTLVNMMTDIKYEKHMIEDQTIGYITFNI